jgi:AraC-like DNA-binding protein
MGLLDATTTDLARFASADAPRALLGEHWCHFQAHDELFGVLLWDTPGAAETAALVASLKLELADGVTPHRSIVDVSRLEGADGGAFDVLNTYVRAYREALSKAVTRLALVRPPGMAGAVAAGFYEVLDSPYPVEVFDDASSALAWLEEPAPLAGTLEALIAQASDRSPLLARLHVVLRGALDTASPALAADALGVSERTLQRRLKAESTTFAAELLTARLSAARRRMVETDAPLAAIALEAGFSSQQHFSRAFKEAEGLTPTAFRREQRED